MDGIIGGGSLLCVAGVPFCTGEDGAKLLADALGAGGAFLAGGLCGAALTGAGAGL